MRSVPAFCINQTSRASLEVRDFQGPARGRGDGATGKTKLTSRDRQGPAMSGGLMNPVAFDLGSGSVQSPSCIMIQFQLKPAVESFVLNKEHRS